jgi:1-acyl-sn-glycerol-3-phosphate acyltransferase
MKIMKHTVFDSFLLKTFLRWISMFILRIFGWKTVRNVPDLPKYVMIAAPHTSNWDFVLTILMAFALDLKIYMMAKKEITEWPMGSAFKWMGVIPIDRSQSNNTVAQAIQLFEENEKLVIVVPPSGTRKKVKKWKTGFYHIANGANIPIVLGFLDYARKSGGLGHVIEPTGDIETDMIEIRGFYADISGKYPKYTFRNISAEVSLP